MDPAARPVPMIDPVRRFVLFTNGKCGGSTLKTWFFANLDLAALERRPVAFLRAFGLRYALRYVRRGRREAPRGAGLQDLETIRRFTNHYRDSYCVPALAADATAGFFNFAVARHPEARAVSAFVDKFCGEDRHTPWVRAVIDRAGTAGEISFDGFLDYLEAAGDDCNPHWRRQTYIFGGRRMDAIVRLEHLPGDFARIADRVGGAHVGILAAKRQSTRYDAGAAEAAMAFGMSARSAAEVIAWSERHGGFPPKEAFLTPAARAQIRRIYARDFEALPYG